MKLTQILYSKTGIILAVGLILVAALGLASRSERGRLEKNTGTVTTSFYEDFDGFEEIEEAYSFEKSRSENWWLNSGGFFYVRGGAGETIQGKTAPLSRWRIVYYFANPEDTDSGSHPQNIFRLITKNRWRNVREESYFLVTASNLSESQDRNASNGLLLMTRYQDDDNLYYTGLRVDGAAVVKKKAKGAYYTLAYEPFFEGSYNRDGSRNLIPEETWIGIRSETRTLEDNSVEIKLFADVGRTGNWELILEAKDAGIGGAPILEQGSGGIRTDFMDVKFDDYRIEEI